MLDIIRIDRRRAVWAPDQGHRFTQTVVHDLGQEDGPLAKDADKKGPTYAAPERCVSIAGTPGTLLAVPAAQLPGDSEGRHGH